MKFCNFLLLSSVEQQKTLAMQQLKEEAERAAAMQLQFAKDQDRAQKEHFERLERKMQEDAEADRKYREEMITHRLEAQQKLMEEGFKREADALKARADDLNRFQQQLACQQRRGPDCVIS